MSDLTGRTQNDTFKDLLHIENTNLGFDGTLRQVETGDGTGSALSLSTVGASIAGALAVAGIASFANTPNVNGNTMWHAGNDGIGSGLDADTVRGVVPTGFDPSSNQTITGDWQFDGALSTNTTLGSVDVLGAVDFDLEAGFNFYDGVTQEGRIGFFDDTAGAIVIENYHATGDILVESVNGFVDIRSDIDDMFLAAGAFLDIGAADDISILSGTDIFLENVNGAAFQTQRYDLATTSSSALIYDGFGQPRDAGFNVMPPLAIGSGYSIGSNEVGGKLNYTGAGSSNWDILVDASIPVGATWVLSNIGTSIFNMLDTGITLTWLDGSGVLTTGARVLAIGAIATLHKRATGQYEIWGAGLS